MSSSWSQDVIGLYEDSERLVVEVEDIIEGVDIPERTEGKHENEEEEEEEENESITILSHHVDEYIYDEDVPGDGHEFCLKSIPSEVSSLVYVVANHEHSFVPTMMLSNRPGRKVYVGRNELVLVTGHNQHLAMTQDNQFLIAREIQILRDLIGVDHVMQIKQAIMFDNPEYFGFITPYYRGVNATKAIQGNLYLISKFMKQLLGAVADIHERGIVHRDLCFENVVWNPLREELTIIDFDLAVPLRKEGYYIRAGRENYDAPEKTKAMDYFGNRVEWNSESPKVPPYNELVDEYACGIMLWMLLSESTDAPSHADIKKWYQKVQRKKLDKKDPEIHFTMGLLATLPSNRTSARNALNHPFLTDTEPDKAYIDFRAEMDEFVHEQEEEEEEEEEEDTADDEDDEDPECEPEKEEEVAKEDGDDDDPEKEVVNKELEDEDEDEDDLVIEEIVE
jgi:serine/threonine protein kinase